ncbi:MAG: type II toxin-antitoxin system RelE/ParE family toxin [Gammaproteobacteria bacterium]|nr:type II toxin-antitoxin system RelE/ParE family toxin [Gammaproteobacteria bacterium]
MLKLKFTDSAQLDLESVTDFTIENWGNNQAETYLNQLQELLNTLAENPTLGLMRESLGTNIQSFQYKSHHIFYFCENDTLHILRILHGSSDPIWHLT